MAETTSSKKLGNFIKSIPPFHLLPEMTIQEMALSLTINHYTKEETIISPDGPPNSFLYIVQAGGVKFLTPGQDVKGDEKLVDMRGVKEIFGLFSLLSNSPSPFKIVAAEDTICYLIPKKIFKRILDNNPDVLLYFTMGPSKGVTTPAPQSSPEPSESSGFEMDSFLFSKRIKDIMHDNVLTCPPDETVMGAAQAMDRRGVGSIIVADQENALLGIITDGDLRGRVLAAGRQSDTPVREIMSTPVQSISPEAYTSEAILTLMKTRYKYLTILEGEELAGIVSERDLMISQGNNPVAVIREIQQADNLKQLVQIRKNMDRTMLILMERGGGTKEICELITYFNDHLTQKVIQLSEETLVQEGLGPPPVPYAWVALGSEGRSEQTLTTDQDNALFFEDVEPSREQEMQQYFLTLAQKVVSGLELCGFARCQGDIMASNPKWCQPQKSWQETYKKWIFNRELTSQDITISSLFFDLRTIYGPEHFVNEVRESINGHINENKRFIPLFALTAMELKTPISFFNRFVVEKTGAYKNRFNLKLHGLIPLIATIRILSLDHKIAKTNTLERIEALIAAKAIVPEVGSDLKEAFNQMMLLRFRHSVGLIKQGKEPDNYINPSELSMIQRTLLKMAFKTIDELQDLLEIRYGLTALRQR